MHRTFTHSREMSDRALRWLVDVKRGYATGGELNDYLTGTRRGYTVMSVIRFLVRNGWVTVRDHDDVEPNVNKCNIYITDAGRLWRDYLEFEPGRLALTRLELHARVRALEGALAPLVRMHNQYLARGYVSSAMATEAECRFADTVLTSPDSDSVVYPWTPNTVAERDNERDRRTGATHPLDWNFAASAANGTG